MASSMAFSRFKNGRAAEVRNRMTALGSTMAVVVGALKMERERISATRTVSSLQQLCSRCSSDSKLLGQRNQSGCACLYCLLICIDDSYRLYLHRSHFSAESHILLSGVTFGSESQISLHISRRGGNPLLRLAPLTDYTWNTLDLS